MSDKRNILHADPIENVGEIAGLFDLPIAALRMGRQPHAAKIWHNHCVLLRERLGERHPHVARVAETMQKHDSRARASDTDVLRTVAYRHLFGVEGRGPVLDRRTRRGRGEEIGYRDQCDGTANPERFCEGGKHRTSPFANAQAARG